MENENDEFVWDKKSELIKAKEINHFSKDNLEDLVRTRTNSPKEIKHVLDECANIIYICEAYDIKLEWLTIDVFPRGYVDVRPSVKRGWPYKFGEISYYDQKALKVKVPPNMTADFDISVWGVETTKTNQGDWEINLDKVPIIPPEK